MTGWLAGWLFVMIDVVVNVDRVLCFMFNAYQQLSLAHFESNLVGLEKNEHQKCWRRSITAGFYF